MAAKTAVQEYESRKRNIISKLAGINKLLKKHAKKQEQNPNNWGFVGDLGKVEELLSEIQNLLGAEINSF